MASKNERVYRALFSAIIGSPLTVREIRSLVEELSSRGELIYTLQDELWRWCDEMDGRFGRRSYMESHSDGANSYIAELILERIGSKRLPKSELRSILGRLGGEDKLASSSKSTVRNMIEQFVAHSPPGRVSELMGFLGMDIEEDAYLGGISRKSKGL